MSAIVQLLVKHGYSVLFASVFARQMWLPVPAILVLIAAGALAGFGRMTLAVALGLAIIACLLADMVWFETGRRWGDRILHFIYGLALDPDAAARWSKEIFVRHGLRTLVLAKFVVGLDAATPSLAGLSGISRLRFIAFDAVGAALWSGAYAGLGYVFGKDLDRAAAYAVRLGTLWLIVVFASVAIYVGRKLVRWRRFVHECRMSRITPEELKEKLDAGEKVRVIDLHGGRDGLRGHQGIPGAVCIDSRRLGRANHDGRMPIPPIPRDCEVVLYCSTPHELTSASLALQLRRRGFEHVRPLAGGLRAWRERSFPVTLVILCGADELCRSTAISAYGKLRAVLCAQYAGRRRSALEARKVLSRVMALNLRCATTSSRSGEVTSHANVPQLSPSEGD
jgi:membrane protein DedA with SNARE-associated domain/rhodanese-related sulfurtransferase